MMTLLAKAEAMEVVLKAAEEYLWDGTNATRNRLDMTVRRVREVQQHEHVHDTPQLVAKLAQP
jgi:hypothetical protein